MCVNDPNLPIDSMTPEEQALVDSCLTILNKNKIQLTSQQKDDLKTKAKTHARQNIDPKTQIYTLLVETLTDIFGKDNLLEPNNLKKLEAVIQSFKDDNPEFTL